MASYNKVIVVGNLTRDPEIKNVRDTKIAEFSIAVNDRVKKGNEWVDEATFLDVTFFDKTADVIEQYLKKGSQCLVEGRLKQESWEDKNGGGKRSKIKIIGSKMQMLGGKGEGGGRQSSSSESNSDGFYDEPAPKRQTASVGADDADVPF